MNAWLIGGYAVLFAALVAYATIVAVSGKDPQHRADAYKVLKLIWSTATGASGVVALAIELHELGVL